MSHPHWKTDGCSCIKGDNEWGSGGWHLRKSGPDACVKHGGECFRRLPIEKCRATGGCIHADQDECFERCPRYHEAMIRNREATKREEGTKRSRKIFA